MLEAGEKTVCLDFRKRWLRDNMLEYFMGQNSSSLLDVRLKIRLMDRNTEIDLVPDSLFHAKRRNGDGFTIEGGMMSGMYEAERKTAELLIHPLLVETSASRVFEQIIYQAYVTACDESYGLMPLVHSSGVIKDGRGYLFVGASEAGKSTAAALSSGYKIINDEICIADISKEVPKLVSTPFNGLYRIKQSGRAPLAGIFILKKADEHSVAPVSGAAAVKLIASQLIPPVGLGDIMQSEDYLKQIDIASELCSRVPVYELSFRKDPGFWKEIEQISD